MTRDQALRRLDAAWQAFEASWAGLSERQLLIPGVTGRWSVRDLIAHVTWWDEEALEHLPTILGGKRPARYSVKYGGIDAFNALRTEERRALSLARVLHQHREVHARLLAYLRTKPEALFATETRFRRRLKLDTWGHYPIHTRGILKWRSTIDD